MSHSEIKTLLSTYEKDAAEVKRLTAERDALQAELEACREKADEHQAAEYKARQTHAQLRSQGDPRAQEAAQEIDRFHHEREMALNRDHFIENSEIIKAGRVLTSASEALREKIKAAWDVASMIELDGVSELSAREALVRSAICNDKTIAEYVRTLGLTLELPEAQRAEIRRQLATKYGIPEAV